MIHLSLCLIIRIPCSSGASSVLCQSERSLLWTAPSVGIALPYRKKAKKKNPPPPQNPAARIAFALWPWREMMVMRPDAPATCLRNLLGKTPASQGSPASSASWKIRSAACLLSMLHTWADTRKEIFCTLCPHAISFHFPAQTCCSGCSLPRADEGSACWKQGRWRWPVMQSGRGVLRALPTAHRQLEGSCRSSWMIRCGQRQEPPLRSCPTGSCGKGSSIPLGSLQWAAEPGAAAPCVGTGQALWELCAHRGLCSETRVQGHGRRRGHRGWRRAVGGLEVAADEHVAGRWWGMTRCCRWHGDPMDEHVPWRSLGVKKHCGWHGARCGWRRARRLLWEKRRRWRADCYVRPGHRGVPQTGTRFQYWN